MEHDFNKVDMKSFKCPACGTSLDYSQLLKAENVVLKRYQAIIDRLKMDYGEVFLERDRVLIGYIKELEHLYSILIKK